MSSPSGKASAWRTAQLVPVDVKVGDRILFGKYSSSDIKLDGEEYLIMREDEILGVMEQKPKTVKTGRLMNDNKTERSSHGKTNRL